MEIFALVWALLPLVFGYLLYRCWKAGRSASEEAGLLRAQLEAAMAAAADAVSRAEQSKAAADRAAPFLQVADVADEAARLVAEADASAKKIAEGARARVIELLTGAKSEAESIERAARASAAAVVADAQARAGEAMAYMGREQELRAIVQALENRLRGYDASYIKPAAILLDGLADSYGSAQAALDLKAARAHVRQLLKDGRAAACDYAEANRRETATRFVAEAFNGAADSILARVKVDNVGKLTQELQDAASLVNYHGSAFRNARVTDEFVAARRAELVAAARFQGLLKREQEEQKAIRERIREEARAQREFEQAQRQAAREEERVMKALQDATKRFESAASEDRAKWEAKLLELQGALAEAQAKNVRALSMAQQTRAGHCYVISNEGSFGVDVLKIGMTRRLDPLDRVRELGDASVPFEFDVHAMIFSDDAPGLEKRLHRAFNETRVNMVNPRKEYFQVGVGAVRDALAQMGVEAEFTLAAEAREFRESQALRHASEAERRAVLEAVLAAEEHIEDDAEDAAEVAAPAEKRAAERDAMPV